MSGLGVRVKVGVTSGFFFDRRIAIFGLVCVVSVT